MQHPPLDYERMITEENADFIQDNVKAISLQNKEPDWMLQARLESFAKFQKLPMPGKKDEEWRKTDISALEYSRFLPSYDGSLMTLEKTPEQFREDHDYWKEEGNVAVAINGTTISRELSLALQEQGVIWCDFATAVVEHNDLVQKYFAKWRTHLEEDKFTSLNHAFWNAGTFLYIPKNVSVELPLCSLRHLESTSAAHFPHTMIILDEGANLCYFEKYSSGESKEQLFIDNLTEIFLEAGANLQYVSLHDFTKNVYNFSYRRAVVAKDANLKWLVGTFGGKVTKSVVSSILEESGAETEMLGISVGDKDQFIDQNTHQIHEAPNTRSDLLFKNAVKQEGYSLYRGTIEIAKHAQKSDAYQTNRNLMLGDKARAESIPALEIIANDVRCSHGASVSQVDPEQIFYLGSRGICREDAIQLIVDGYFDAVIRKISQEKVAKFVQANIRRKVGSLDIV